MSNWPLNPFWIGRANWGEHGLFLSRDDLLDRLSRHIESPNTNAVVLFGPRRMGKTSVIQRLAEQWRKVPDVRVLDIDLLGITDVHGQLGPDGDREFWSTVHAGLILQGVLPSTETARSSDELQAQWRKRAPSTIKSVRLLIDEAQILYESDPRLLHSLLRCFQTPEQQPVVRIVLSWGRPLGSHPAPEVAALLKDVPQEQIGPISKATLARDISAAFQSVGVPLSPAANDLIWSVSQGHPYYAMATAHELFEMRRAAESPATIEEKEITRETLVRATVRIEHGLVHSWDQVSSAQIALCWGLAMLAFRAVENPDSFDFGDDAHTLTEVLDYLKTQGLHGDDAMGRSAATDLVANYVLMSVGVDKPARYRIRSPLFAVWLANHSFASLDPDARRVEPSTGQTALDFIDQARQSMNSGDLNRATQMLKRAQKLAPVHPDLLVEFARLAERRGELSTAASYLRQAQMRGDLDAIRAELAQVLEKQIQAAIHKGDYPADLWEEYRLVGSNRPLSRALSHAVGEAFALHWRSKLDEGQLKESLLIFRKIERSTQSLALDGWRSKFWKQYAEFLQTHAQSPERLKTCLASLALCLLPLSDITESESSSPDPSILLSTLPETLRRLVERVNENAKTFGDLDQDFIDELIPELERRQNNHALDAWEMAQETLRRARILEVDLPDVIDLNTLNLLWMRAPSSCDMREFLKSDLEGFLAWDIESGNPRAEDILGIILDIGGILSLHTVHDHIANRLLHMEQRGIDDAQRTFAMLPGVLYKLREIAEIPPPTSTEDYIEFFLKGLRVVTHDENWRIFARQPSVMGKWRRLLLTVSGGEGSRRLDLLDEFGIPDEYRAIIDRSDSDAPNEDDSKAIAEARRLLDRQFFRIDNIVSTGRTDFQHLASRFRGAWRRSLSEPFINTHIKLFRLPGDDIPTRKFLETLWAHERRVLLEIGSRREGRALASLRSADLNIEQGYLVLVTEPTGSLTLRDLLDAGRTEQWRTLHQGTLWRELGALMQGVEALHDAHYMHRNLRPDTIYVRHEGDLVMEDFRFKLVDFEWSVYIHSISSHHEGRRRPRDFYCAPEVIRAEFGGVTTDGDVAGEVFASDLYGLGLILFELLIRPLSALELKEFRDRREYSAIEHRDFISRLRAEIQDATELPEEARLMMLGLTRNRAASRVSSLRSMIAQAKQIALGTADLQAKLDKRPLPLVATLSADTQESIIRFIKRYPGIRNPPTDQAAARTFIENELMGAHVYENATSEARPLFIEGRLVNFTVSPFEVKHSTSTELAYLYVATKLDVPKGDAIGRLGAGVLVYNLLPDLDRSKHLNDGDARWVTLFALVGDSDTPDSVEDHEQQKLLHQALHLTAEAEESYNEEQIIGYRLVEEPSTRGQVERIKIGPRATSAEQAANSEGEWRLALRRMIATNSQLEAPVFELMLRRSISEWVDEDRIWNAIDIDAEDETIVLARPAGGGRNRAPREGYVRPRSLSGSQVILARRRALLQRLVGERHVLNAMSQPAKFHHENAGQDREWFLDLDPDKQRIVRRMQSAQPMLMVQGPPGTGKTTLAAEVILQELAASPASRILVTAQGHDPLNHLLDTVTKGIKGIKAVRSSLVVRLVPERRLTVTSDEMLNSGREIEIEHGPSKVTENLLVKSLQWKPVDFPVDPDLIRAWHGFVDDQRKLSITAEIQERVIRSANIVFATANDKSVEAADRAARPYDLVIYEEAGRALPLELFGPMIRGSRWLLIGDPEQLPPHQVGDLRRILESQLDSDAIKDRELRESRHSPRRRKAIQILELFRELWRRDSDSTYSDRLTVQYRMHPAIAQVVSETYYDGILTCAEPDALRKNRSHRIARPTIFAKRAIIWVDIPCVANDGPLFFGETPASSGGYTNHAELQVIHDLFQSENFMLSGGSKFAPGEVAFLSPYRAQIQRFQRVFGEWTSPGKLKSIAYTVDSFQGRQASMVFVSLVRNNNHPTARSALGFLTQPSRSVVMFSRAESLLVVLGSSEHFCAFDREHSPIRRFYEAVVELEADGDALVINSSEILTPVGIERLRRHHEASPAARRKGARMRGKP